jgi:hypothetical protein
MTTPPGAATRRRSLQDDLLDDLRQGPARVSAPPVAAPSPPSLPSAAQRAPSLEAAPTPAVELRITPWSWSSAGWTRGPDGAGLAISLGPVCLSLGRLRS